MRGIKLLGGQLGVKNSNKVVITSPKKARVALLGNYQNALFMIRYGETSNLEVCNCKIVQINTRQRAVSFKVVAGTGSIPLYYNHDSNNTMSLYMDTTVLSYPIIDVILLSWTDGYVYVTIQDASDVDFSTLRTVTI